MPESFDEDDADEVFVGLTLLVGVALVVVLPGPPSAPPGSVVGGAAVVVGGCTTGGLGTTGAGLAVVVRGTEWVLVR